ncbi:MAG: FadR family transcriptional regulator [Caulobacteraceae bacterium]|nr:FadR family transcriptional regulator [Caulobacteraceae bacterium]
MKSASTAAAGAGGPPALKLSQRVAQQIVADISQGDWRVGDLLGTEAELIAKYGVSRATLGEAVRQVERQGIAVMRRGPRGGLTITAPATGAVSRTISTYLELSDVSLEEQFEAWRIVEVRACGVAARRVTRQGVETLQAMLANIDETADPQEYLRRCMKVRIAIADLTGNPALALFIRVLVRVLGRKVYGPAFAEFIPENLIIRQHLGEIVQAVANGDAVMAQAIAQMNLAVRRDAILGLREAGRLVSPAHQATGAHAPRGGDEKLAYVTAQRIRDDIAAMGWPTGEKVGDEAELLERYGVSRWVLRQAIRTLEVHAVIHSKRGQRGGLMVGLPDPEQTITSASAYLQCADFTVADLHEVWAHLLENLAGMAATNPKAASSEIMKAAAQPSSSRSLSDFRDERRLFYRELSLLSLNRVVSLFVAILERFINEMTHRPLEERVLDLIARHRSLVAEAVLAGDAGRARRTMADFMDLVREHTHGREEARTP